MHIINSLEEDNKNLLNKYKKSLDYNIIVSKTDPKGLITFVNDNFCKISGYTREELMGKSHSVVKHPETKIGTFKAIWTTIQKNKIWRGLIKNKTKDGDFYIVDTTIIPITDNNDIIIEYFSIRLDLTKLLKNKILFLDTIDDNTGLPNRQKLIEELLIENNKALIILNISGFREMNEFYGSHICNNIIKKMGDILKDYIKVEDINSKIFKFPSDEFIIVLENKTYNELDMFLENLISFLDNKIIHIDEYDILLEWYAGACINENNLLAKADIALKETKMNKANYTIYKDNSSSLSYHSNNLEKAKKIKTGLKEDRFIPYYQAIINNKTQKVEKFEALIRLIDNEVPISPFYFLETAKKIKLYPQLTKKVIEHSFKVFQKRKELLSINLTIMDINNNELVSFLEESIINYQMQNKVIFEIVESEGMENIENVLLFIKKMKSFGCKIAIDDFGTGYSNFEYLMKLEVDFIKIDGSIIKNILKNKSSEIIASTITDFAKKLKIQTIAEFVENEEIFKKCQDIGVDFSQGYFFSEPLSQKQMEEKYVR